MHLIDIKPASFLRPDDPRRSEVKIGNGQCGNYRVSQLAEALRSQFKRARQFCSALEGFKRLESAPGETAQTIRARLGNQRVPELLCSGSIALLRRGKRHFLG